MKDIKSTLKEAREAIKNKDFEKSLKLSKSVLKDDKNNYMALVFLGLSLQEVGPLDQAPNAFKKAIENNSTNILAWNGLVNYYEKVDSVEAKNELVKAYLVLLNIETNDKKLIDYTKKLSEFSDFGDKTEIVKAIYNLVKNQQFSNDIVENFWRSLVNLLKKIKELSDELTTIYEEGLEFVINNKKLLTIDYCSDYLNLLFKQNQIEKLLINAEKIHLLFDFDPITLSWICKIFNEYYVEENRFLSQIEAKIDYYHKKLLELEPESGMGLFTKGILLLNDAQIIEATDILKKVSNLRPGLLHLWILLTKCYLKLNLISDSIISALKADKLLKSVSNNCKINLRNQLDCLLCEALSKSTQKSELLQVFEFYKNLSDNQKINCYPHLIRANINLGNLQEAKLLIEESHKSKNDLLLLELLKAQLFIKQNKFAEALDILENEENQLNSDWLIQLGKLYWDINENQKSLIPFLKAAKLAPYNYICFLYLGHYYNKFNDFDKARRCYEKSFKINSKCSEAGIELSQIYRKLKKWDSNIILLENLTENVITKENYWAWLQLGLNYLEQEDYVKAINNFRYVIRIDEKNMHCWECLADAYLARGAYNSALKCYEKAAEVSENALYPALQIATMKQILGEFTEARLDFEKILSTNKFYVPALKGIAETCLLQAKQCWKEQRFGKARDHSQYSVEKLILALKQDSELSCIWKLIADNCVFIAKLPEKYCCLLVPKFFIENRQIDDGNKILEIVDIYNLASRCYCRSLSLTEDNILIWHDLAACYLSHALNSTNTKELLEKALIVAKHCTNKNPTYSQHWNLLGNVALNLEPSNYALAQHAFIKAVTVDNNNAISWCNLGTLYLILDNSKLANEAFSQAQRSDPNYVNSWIGQAFLAENMGHEDTMDLFRHSTQLGAHQQGALGYGHWVCQTLMDSSPNDVIYSIHNMHAIPVACDALTWYTEKNPNDSCAWNMLGMLYERLGLKLNSLKAYKNAFHLSDKSNRDKTRINYGRLLYKLGNYSTAIKTLNDVEAATFYSGSGLALALFKAKQYEESYNAYESVLHWLTDDEESQSDLLSALASMAYKFQGPEPVKVLLFQSIKLSKPSPWGFYATIALGLLHGDLKLASLVLNEIQAFKDRKECIQHYAMLLSYVYLMRNEHLKAIHEISKLIHRHPNQASLWLILSSLLMKAQEKRKPTSAAAKCALASMKLGQTNMDVTKVLCQVSLASFLVGDKKNALLMAQKAVHCYPNIAESWAVLLLSIKNNNSSKSYVKSLIDFIELISESDCLIEWLKKCKQLN